MPRNNGKHARHFLTIQEGSNCQIRYTHTINSFMPCTLLSRGTVAHLSSTLGPCMGIPVYLDNLYSTPIQNMTNSYPGQRMGMKFNANFISIENPVQVDNEIKHQIIWTRRSCTGLKYTLVYTSLSNINKCFFSDL